MRRIVALVAGVALAGCAGTAAAPSPPPLTTARAPEPIAGQVEREEHWRCQTLAASISCPSGARKKVEMGPLAEQGALFCTVTCDPDGPFVKINVSGDSYEQRGQFAGGHRVGIWRRWAFDEDLERVLVAEYQYDNDAHDGIYRTWYVSGLLHEDGAYVNGKRDGPWQEYGANGSLVFEGEFARGVAIGIHRRWFLNGQIQSKQSYDEVGRPDGEWCFYLPDGTRVDRYTLKSGTGTVKLYAADGRLDTEYGIRDGQYHGRFIDHVFGTATYEANYRDGVLHGVERVSYEGCIERETTYIDGKQSGRYLVQDCSSKPPIRVTQGKYCDDQPCGRWVERSADTGMKVQEIEYSDHGAVLGMIAYDENGEIVDFWGPMSGP